MGSRVVDARLPLHHAGPLGKKHKRKSIGARLLNWGPSRLGANLLVAAGVFCVTVFGPRWAYWWARRAATLTWLGMSRLRGTALRNLDLCFPEKTEAERTRIAKASFRHFYYMFCDYMLAPRCFGHGRGERFMEGSPADSPYMLWVAEGKAAFILAAHFGNWEVGTFNVNRFGFARLMVIAKPVKPPALNRRIKRAREIFGNDVHEHTGGARTFARALKDDRTVGILVDQNGGDFAPVETFFGVPCTWQADFARLAVRGGGRIALAAMRRTGERFAFQYLPSKMLQYSRESDPMEIVRDYRDYLEAVIRENPEQYFWMHRRLKARKKGWADVYADLGTRLTPERRVELLASRQMKKAS
jgi:KDO2-lipid IV(A) lauroyltransferase